jgi:hypothetical protein
MKKDPPGATGAIADVWVGGTVAKKLAAVGCTFGTFDV